MPVPLSMYHGWPLGVFLIFCPDCCWTRGTRRSSKPLSCVIVVVARMMSFSLPVRGTGVGWGAAAAGLAAGLAAAGAVVGFGAAVGATGAAVGAGAAEGA